MGSNHPIGTARRSLVFVMAGALSLAVFLLCFVPPLAAQYRGTIHGTVTDPTGAVVPSAKVTLTNTSTTAAVTQQTNASGLYTFEFVQPGTYTVTVEKSGFQRYTQSNVNVMVASDVTVNAILKLGNVAQTVTVKGQAGNHVEFNTSTMKMTVQGTNLANLPVLARNPFTLALLDASVVNRYWDISHRLPFYMWSDNGMDIGGPTGGKNEILLDGTPLNVSARGSYNAPMDAVQQVAVMENVPDARYGFSAGGTLNLAMKTGTNQYHGDVYYFGRQPSLNALANRISRDKAVVKQNIYGGTLGNPIIKNKVFNFFAFELWRATEPSYKDQTLPTAAEKNGDFSGALTSTGAQRIIYNPFTTVFNPATGTSTRTPFANNIIPQTMINPTAQKLMGYLWAPNNPGDNLSGVNNFKKTYPWWTHYWNMSDRVDYNVSDNFRMFARFSKFQTRLDNINWGGTIAVPSDNGGTMDALNTVIDGVWMANPTTALDINMGVTYMEDTYDSGWAKVSPSVWAGLWPNSNWYTNVISSQSGIGIYFPRFNFSGNGSSYTGIGGWWFDQARSYNPTVTLTKEMGKHSLEFGWEWRHQYWQNPIVTGPGSINFNAVDTEQNYLAPNASQSGDMYASALLGVVNSANAQTPLLVDLHEEQVALFAQDNFHLNRRITLNLGLRWEHETAPMEETHKLVQTLDLSSPIPGLGIGSNYQYNVAMPSAVTNIARIPYQFNGAMVYTSAANPRVWQAPWNIFLPRLGIAIRLNDKTAIRAGYARFAVPWTMVLPEETGGLQSYGFAQNTDALTPLNGMPRTVLSNPYPTSGPNINPVQLPVGNSLGRYTDLGNSVTFWNGYNSPWGTTMQTPMNDRINIGIQHQAPFHMFTQATFFMMFEHNAQDPSMWGGSYGYNLNQMNPNLAYEYKGLIDQQVPNPFYNLMPANQMPGSLRNQQTVTVGSLLVPYPQYGTLTQSGWPGLSDHYYSIALQANRPMAHGLTAVIAFNYARQTHSEYFNALDSYNNTPALFDRGLPRADFRTGATYQLPFGQGRQYANHVNKFVNAIIGGWGTSQLFFWRSGDLMTFGAAQVNGDPTQNVPAGYYFNPSVFSVIQPYTLRTNPLYYEGIRGPNWWELDSSFYKTFDLTERVKFQLRMEMYNMPNAFMPSDPDTGIGSSTMGQSTWIAAGNYGREIQFMGRLMF